MQSGPSAHRLPPFDLVARPFCRPQLVTFSPIRCASVALSWPMNFAVATCGKAQVSVALAMIPRSPPRRRHGEFRHRRVGEGFEPGAQAAQAGVDFAEHVDFDAARRRAPRRGREGRPALPFARRTTGPVSGSFEQRRDRRGVAVDRALRAVVGGELRHGCRSFRCFPGRGRSSAAG